MTKADARQRDRELREEVYRQLIALECKAKDTRVINELGLSHGSVRIDIAVVNGHIHGLELKADADTLERLPRQIEGYGKAVDRATLVTAERHLKKALQVIPDWWGVVAVTSTESKRIEFRRVRFDKQNRGVDPLTLAKLMWRDEVLAILEKIELNKKFSRAPRSVLYKELVSRVSRKDLAALVRETLKGRKMWRGQRSPSLYGGSSRPISKLSNSQ